MHEEVGEALGLTKLVGCTSSHAEVRLSRIISMQLGSLITSSQPSLEDSVS